MFDRTNKEGLWPSIPCKQCNPHWSQWHSTGRYAEGTQWLRNDPFVTCSDCGFTRRLAIRRPEKYKGATRRQMEIRDMLHDQIIEAKAARDPGHDWRYADFVWLLIEDTGVYRIVAKVVADGELGHEEVRVIDIGRRGSVMLTNGAKWDGEQWVRRTWRHRDPPSWDEVLNHPVLSY